MSGNLGTYGVTIEHENRPPEFDNENEANDLANGAYQYLLRVSQHELELILHVVPCYPRTLSTQRVSLEFKILPNDRINSLAVV